MDIYEKVDFFSCNGLCDRTLRPLACRIFPLTPYKKDGEEEYFQMDDTGSLADLSDEDLDDEFDEEDEDYDDSDSVKELDY